MFNNAFVPCIDCPSENICNKTYREETLQTEPYKIVHRGSQSVRHKTVECQTNSMEEPVEVNQDEAESEAKLLAFLRRAEPIITEQLKKSSQSRAFRYLPQEPLGKLSVRMTNMLKIEEAKDGDLSATCISWNSSGAMLGIAFGSLQHEDWCVHSGFLAFWNVARTAIDQNKPHQKLDLNACAMCIQFHPCMPSLVAAGTFTGELLLWNLALEADALLLTVGSNEGGHVESLNQIEWVSEVWENSHSRSIAGGDSQQCSIARLLSVGADGKVICWSLDLHRRPVQAKCTKIFQIRNGDQAPLSLPAYTEVGDGKLVPSMNSSDLNGEKSVSLMTAALSPHQMERLVVGTESGGLLLCNLNAVSWAEPVDSRHQPNYPSPVEFALTRQNGPINDVDWSRFHRNLVLSCGPGQTLQLHNVLQRDMRTTLDPGQGAVLAAKFSPFYPSLIACATENGYLMLYDLLGNNNSANEELSEGGCLRPSLLQVINSDEDAEDKEYIPVISLAFNTKNPSLLACGDKQGRVQVWELDGLSGQLPMAINISAIDKLFKDSSE